MEVVVEIYVPTYPPIFGIKIDKIVVTYPFLIVPLDKCFVVTLWTVQKGKQSMKIQIPKEHFPINKKGKREKRNKRIGEKQQLEPFKIEQQIKLSNRGYRQRDQV